MGFFSVMRANGNLDKANTAKIEDNMREAIAFYNSAIQIYRLEGEGRYVDIIFKALCDRAECVNAIGNTTDKYATYLEIVDFAKRHNIANDDALIEAKFLLAFYSNKLAKFDDATNYYTEVINYFNTNKMVTKRLAQAYFNIANINKVREKYSDAVKGYMDSSKIFAKTDGKDSQDVIDCYDNIIAIYTKQEEINKAIDLCHQCKEIMPYNTAYDAKLEELLVKKKEQRRANLKKPNEYYRIAYNKYSSGSRHQAVEYMDEVLEDFVEAYGENDESTAKIGYYYAKICKETYAKTRYTKAIHALKESIPLFNGNEDSKFIAKAHELLGDLYARNTQNKNALDEYLKAVDFYKTVQYNAGTMADLYMKIGEVHGDINKKIDFYNKAIEIWKITCDADMEARCQKNIADVYYDANNRAQALLYYREYLAISKKLYTDMDSEMAECDRRVKEIEKEINANKPDTKVDDDKPSYNDNKVDDKKPIEENRQKVVEKRKKFELDADEFINVNDEIEIKFGFEDIDFDFSHSKNNIDEDVDILYGKVTGESQESVSVRKQIGESYRKIVKNMMRGQYKAALSKLADALTMTEGLDANICVLIRAKILTDMAEAESRVGSHDKAIEYCISAIRTVGNANKSILNNIMSTLASIYIGDGKFDNTIAITRMTARIFNKYAWHSYWAYKFMARAYLKKKDYVRALQSLNSYVYIVENKLDVNVPLGSVKDDIERLTMLASKQLADERRIRAEQERQDTLIKELEEKFEAEMQEGLFVGYDDVKREFLSGVILAKSGDENGINAIEKALHTIIDGGHIEGNKVSISYALRTLGNLYYKKKRYHDAWNMYNAVVDNMDDCLIKADCYYNMVFVLTAYAKYANAVEKCEYALKIYKKLGAKNVADCYLALGNGYFRLGDYKNAMASYVSMTEHAEDESVSLANCYSNMAVITNHEGDNARTKEYLTRAKELFVKLGKSKRANAIDDVLSKIY